MGKLSIDDFLLLWAAEAKTNANPKKMRKYLDAFQNVILKQLELNGEVSIYQFGTFRISQTGGKMVKLHNISTGESERKWCKPKLKVSFEPSNLFQRAVNENNYEIPKIKHRPRKYKTNAERKEVKNASRRKPKESVEKVMLDIYNEIDRKDKENNGEA